MLGKPTVLVVDDNPALRRIVRFLFERRGLRVVEASSSTDAMELVPIEQPAVIIVDLSLGSEPDGHGLLKLLRRDLGGELPIIVCSGSVDEHDRGKMQSQGWTDIWPKPFARIPEHLLRYLPAGPPILPECACGGRGFMIDARGATVLCTACVLRRIEALERQGATDA